MSAKRPASDPANGRPAKRARFSESSERPEVQRAPGRTEMLSIPKFTDVNAIRSILHVPDIPQLVQNVNALRGYVSKPAGTLEETEGRVELLVNWLDAGGVNDLETLLETSNREQRSPLLAPAYSLLSSILTCMRSIPQYHSAVTPLLNVILSERGADRLNRSVYSDDASLVLATMKLWLEMSMIDRWQAKVSGAWNWGGKAGSKLLGMRRRGKSATTVNSLERPDIRTLYILFLLSFLSASSPPALKQFLLSQKDTFTAIFKDIRRDQVDVIRKILEVCWDGVWEDKRLRRTLKIGIFNEWLIGHIIRLYDRAEKEDDYDLYAPADLAHHFLLAICTRPGAGICFTDNGWYPRESGSIDDDAEVDADDRDEDRNQNRSRIHNRVLGNIVRTLKVGEDPRQQELALKILEACPELVAGYWSAVNLTLEPRLSSRWLANITYFSKVISLPIPLPSFRSVTTSTHQPSQASYRPNAPSLSVLLANSLPAVLSRVHLTKGLQSKHGLVQLFTANTLARCFDKFERIRCEIKVVEDELGETGEGLWSDRRRELEAEARRRVPDFSVIIAFSQQKFDGDQAGLATKAMTLKEAAMRLLWCCQRSLPDIVAEARFDCGKLFMGLKGPAESTEASDISGLDALSHLHAVRLLRANDQFSWSVKAGASPYTYFYHILMLQIKSHHPTVRSACEDLVKHLLSNSLLFEHDPSELHIWLQNVPRTTRDGSLHGPDGSPLTDEAHSVAAMLDDCLHRCLRTPYRYLEELSSMLLAPEDGPLLASQAADLPSPLFVTLLEQVKARRNAGQLSFSDKLALLSYARRLIFGFCGKQSGFVHSRPLVQALSEAAGPGSSDVDDTWPPLQQELDLLSDSLEFLEIPLVALNNSQRGTVSAFISNGLSETSDDENTRRLRASKLVDNFRLHERPLDSDSVRSLIETVDKLSPDGMELVELLQYLNPKTMNMWSAISTEDVQSLLSRACLSPFVAFLHAGNNSDSIPNPTPYIVEAARGLMEDEHNLLRFLRIVLHRMEVLRAMKEQQPVRLTSIVGLLGGLLELPMPARIHESVGALLFGTNSALSTLLMDKDLSEASEKLVKAGLHPNNEGDLALAAPFCHHCLEHQQLGPELNHNLALMRRICCWAPYMSANQLLAEVDFMLTALQTRSLEPEHISSLLQISLGTLLTRNDMVSLRTLRSKCLPLLKFGVLLHDQQIRASLERILRLSVPLGYNGADSLPSIYSWTCNVERHWTCTLQQSADEDMTDIEDADVNVTEDALKMIAPLAYRSTSCREMGTRWSATIHSADRQSILRPLAALLDVESLVQDIGAASSNDSDIIVSAESFIPIAAETLVRSVVDRDSVDACVLVLKRFSELKGPSVVASAISQFLPPSSPLPFGSASLSFILWALTRFPTDFSASASAYLGGGLRWIVRRFSEDETDSSELLESLPLLGELVERTPAIKKHLVDPVLTAVWRSRFLVPEALELASKLCHVTEMESETVIRHLQAVLQHAQFRTACSVASPSTRDTVIQIVRHLFQTTPHATHQTTYVRQLLTVYSGSMSSSDMTILRLVQDFEKARSAVSLLLEDGSGRPNDALLALDPYRIFKTCLDFPIDRRFEGHADKPSTDGQDVYDPVYALGMFSAVLGQYTFTGLEWVQICRTNILCLTICALASRNQGMRRAGLALLTGTWKAIQDVTFLERDQLAYNLQLLRNVLALESDVPDRLPTYTVLLLAHAVHALFHPSALIYPHVSQFLLQRPVLDPTDVPMLYRLLYSSSDDWKRERLWIVRFVGHGMRSAADWAALRRRRTWDLLATVFQIEVGDKQLRGAILDVLGALTAYQASAHSLVLRSSLLSWIFAQLLALPPSSTEALPFLRILENITITVSQPRADGATYGSWRADVARCTGLALGITGSGKLERLQIGVRILLRLTSPSEPHRPSPPALFHLLDSAVSVLKELETGVLTDVPVPSRSPPAQDEGRVLRTVTAPSADLDPLQQACIWSSCIRFLWRAGMALDPSPEQAASGLLDLRSEAERREERRSARRWWNELTPRLVGLAGRDAGGEEGEWARREVGRAMVLGSLGGTGLTGRDEWGESALQG